MRAIKFRGKSKETGKWLYGCLAEVKRTCFNTTFIDKVIFDNLAGYNTDNFAYVVKDSAVFENTVGQFSGLKDKNGREIYEGDIVLQKGYNGKKIPMLVRFECGAFIVGYHNGSSTKKSPMLLNGKCEVIGNIFDYKELLED